MKLLHALALIALLFCAPVVSQPVFADGFDKQAANCSAPPAGFRVFETTWGGLMYGATWPKSPSHLVPIGSWPTRKGNSVARYGTPAAGLLVTVPITSDGDNHKLGWVGAQPIPNAGYGIAQAADRITVAISPCRADTNAACRGTARSGGMFYGPSVAMEACRFQAGKKLWLTFYANDGVNPLTNTCRATNPSLGVRCEANFDAR